MLNSVELPYLSANNRLPPPSTLTRAALSDSALVVVVVDVEGLGMAVVVVVDREGICDCNCVLRASN